MIKRFLILLFLFPVLAFPQGSRNESVLATGTWYKIAVRNTGIHQITYDDLVALGMDPASILPSNIRVYGNGGGMLPEMNSKPRVSDLRENPVLVFDGNDGAFNPGDFVLFYGEAPDRVRFNTDTKLFEHVKNIYSDTAFYFINADLGPGRRIGSLASTTLAANSYSNRFSDFAFHDVDAKNLIRSGKIWVGEEFNDTINEHSLEFVFPNNGSVYRDFAGFLRITESVLRCLPLQCGDMRRRSTACSKTWTKWGSPSYRRQYSPPCRRPPAWWGG